MTPRTTCGESWSAPSQTQQRSRVLVLRNLQTWGTTWGWDAYRLPAHKYDRCAAIHETIFAATQLPRVPVPDPVQRGAHAGGQTAAGASALPQLQRHKKVKRQRDAVGRVCYLYAWHVM